MTNLRQDIQSEIRNRDLPNKSQQWQKMGRDISHAHLLLSIGITRYRHAQSPTQFTVSLTTTTHIYLGTAFSYTTH
jgi:hypothetical protein